MYFPEQAASNGLYPSLKYERMFCGFLWWFVAVYDSLPRIKNDNRDLFVYNYLVIYQCTILVEFSWYDLA